MDHKHIAYIAGLIALTVLDTCDQEDSKYFGADNDKKAQLISGGIRDLLERDMSIDNFAWSIGWDVNEFCRKTGAPSLAEYVDGLE